MSVKIGITGTHSTGKTTIINDVSAKLSALGFRVKTTSDLASEARRHGFPILRDHTFESTLWIITTGISLELQAGLNSDIVLVDRPAPDALGYLFAALGHRDEVMPSQKMEYLQRLVAYHTATYDRVYKTQLNHSVPIGVEKTRDLDLAFREAAATGIDRVFAELKLSFDRLGADMDENCGQVLRKALSLLERS